MKPIPFQYVEIDSDFWLPRINQVRAVTVPACLDQCEKSGRLDNFRKAAGRKEGDFKGIFFDDSDVYKVLEGAAYCLQDHADPELENRVDGIIDDICAAQQETGYIDTYFILADPDRKWTDMDMHEAYCLGHMTEAGIAYAQATGKTALLNCAIRGLAYMMSLIGPGKRHWVTGHQELELALVRLYRYTGETRYLDFARWLVGERGNDHFDSDRQRYYHTPTEYYQDDKPIEQLERVTGHAVRAMYYYTGVADLVAVEDNAAWREALNRIWHNVVPANLYITGGIGQCSSNEGFTENYHKPCLTAYCETCAAIGMALWNHRMNLLSGERRFADLVETEMYNGILSGISLSGDKFFYDNPLASIGQKCRVRWFDCSCCPTNLCRFIPSVGGYAYSIDDNAVWLNQFIGGNLHYQDGEQQISLRVETDYPKTGRVKITVLSCSGIGKLRIRVPAWCTDWKISDPSAVESDGYIQADIAPGMEIRYDMEMPVRRVYEDPRVRETAGRVCFCRGPVVYCAEEVDNKGVVPSEYFHSDLTVSRTDRPEVSGQMDSLEGAIAIRVGELTLIPYALWDNRERSAMTVWIREKD